MRIGLSKNQDVIKIVQFTLDALVLEAEKGKLINAETLRNAELIVYRGIPGEGDSVHINLPMWAEPEPGLDRTDFTGGRRL